MGEIRDFFLKLLDTGDFPERWHCGKWSDFHGWLYIGSNLLIWSAYFMIPLLIIRYVARQKQRIHFNRVYLLFATFIIACGATHFIDAMIFWIPAYRLNALVLLFTGIVSWVTIFALLKILPTAFSLKSPVEFESEIALRKQKEEQLMKKNATLLHAETMAKLCSWIWDVKNDRIEWSEASAEIFNTPEGLGTTLNDFINKVHPDDMDYLHTNVARIIEAKKFTKLYYRILTPFGEVRDVVSVGEVVCNEVGEVVEMLGTLQDITEKKKQMRAMEDKNRKLMEVSYIQSHAVRGHVATILGLTEIFNLEDYDDKKNETVIESIRIAANNLDKQIRELTDIIEDKG